MRLRWILEIKAVERVLVVLHVQTLHLGQYGGKEQTVQQIPPVYLDHQAEGHHTAFVRC